MIQGVWFSQGRAQKYDATLQVRAQSYVISVEGGELLQGDLNQLTVSDRIGNVERKLTLSDGSVFASRENDAIDDLLQANRNGPGLIHFLESRVAWILLALVITIGSAIAGFRWGVPLASEFIAHALPHKTNALIANETLSFLDEFTFKPSQLSAAKQNRIRDHFRERLVPLDEKNQHLKYTLHFRAWDYAGKSIPNALALPSGDIIVTDQFINLSQNQAQIDSVLLHEMGHVVHRHSLQKLIETTLIGATMVMISGDSNSAVDMGVGLGSIMVTSHYSRNHEYEADAYAFEKMLQAGIDPQAFAKIMQRMQHFMNSKQHERKNNRTARLPASTEKPPLGKIIDYLSSHPSTEKRVQQAQAYSQCFKQKSATCDRL